METVWTCCADRGNVRTHAGGVWWSACRYSVDDIVTGRDRDTSPSPSPSPVVLAQVVGSMGTILVAASNRHTVYRFNSDTPGVSNCKGGCISAWPPLSVSAGKTPTGGTGVTGQLGTITRDDESLQVTYKGLPLYFFHSDSKPGDTNGNYTGWSLVKP